MIKLVISLIFIGVFAVSCEKDNENINTDDPSQVLVFSSLRSEKYSITAGESTKITATAAGYQIRYLWEASAGNIVGSGSEVTYVASPCHVGENEITCTVSDGNNKSESKSLTIVVQ